MPHTWFSHGGSQLYNAALFVSRGSYWSQYYQKDCDKDPYSHVREREMKLF